MTLYFLDVSIQEEKSNNPEDSEDSDEDKITTQMRAPHSREKSSYVYHEVIH